MPTDTQAARTILVVEEDDTTRKAVANTLQDAGYTVVAVAHGQNAIARLVTGLRPDLILLGIFMPVLDGWRFLKGIQRLVPWSAPVVVATATLLAREWTSKHGCAGLLQKPIRPDELLAETQRVLGPS